MAHLDTGQEILAWFLRRAGELFPTHTTADLANADRLIDAKIGLNQAYWDVCAAKPWRWARKDPPKQFASIAKQTVTVNSISAADPAVVTLSATIATSQAGRKVYTDGDGIPFRIDDHTAGTATLTLVTAYTGDVKSGGGAIFMDEVTVASDILAFPLITELHTHDIVTVVGEEEFEEHVGKNVRDSVRARYATFITDSKLRLGPHPTARRLFECAHNYRPSPLTFDGVASTDTPIVPRNARALIGLFALRGLFVDKRDARLAPIQGEIDEKYTLISGTELTFSRPRTFVRRGARVML